MSTSLPFVLVHGAWHGGWCYARVAERLRAAGHLVYTPTLTGVGERSHLCSAAVNLSLHIEDVMRMIRWEGLERFVLVGHSYGGMVVTGVADRLPEAVHTLVYLDAFLPTGDQSLFDLAPAEATGAMETQARERTDGCVLPIPAELFNVNPADRAWVDSRCTPQPLATFTERLRLVGGLDRVERRIYALARDNKLGGGFQAFHDQAAADPRFRCFSLPGGHDLMIDSPGEVTRLLLDGCTGAL